MEAHETRSHSGASAQASASNGLQRESLGRAPVARMQPTKIILAVGAPAAGHEPVFDLIARAGVVPAAPSRRDGHTPQGLSQLLLQALEVDATTAPAEQLRPGKVWQELATELALANLQHPLWGWADHQVAWLMDFWLEMDPQVRLLLVYTTPAEQLARLFRGRAVLTAAEVERTLRQWYEWNTVLLRYHLRHPRQSILINAPTALANPPALLQLLAHEWGVRRLQEPNIPSQSDESQAVLVHAAQTLITPGHAVESLVQQLHNAAQLPGSDAGDPGRGSLIAWAPACKLVAQLDDELVQLRAASQARSQQAEQLERARRENEQLLWQLKQGQEELEQLVVRLQEGAKEAEQLRQRRDQLQQELQARLQVAQRSELLLLQLDQVQEELKRYFLQCQQLQQAAREADFVLEFWRTHQPEVVTVDFRNHIIGDQWHEAEASGRWSGPNAISTLKLPALCSGSYLLELDIVGAIADDLLPSAQIELGGQVQPLVVEYLGDGESLPAVCSATFSIDDPASQAPVQLCLRLPRTVSPAEQGAGDTRQLGLLVQQLRLIRRWPGNASAE